MNFLISRFARYVPYQHNFFKLLLFLLLLRRYFLRIMQNFFIHIIFMFLCLHTADASVAINSEWWSVYERRVRRTEHDVAIIIILALCWDFFPSPLFASSSRSLAEYTTRWKIWKDREREGFSLKYDVRREICGNFKFYYYNNVHVDTSMCVCFFCIKFKL